tara:strand:+ start:19270 stop:19905 length:636 start_codon:yes stop_codon:yes gene_type:complete
LINSSKRAYLENTLGGKNGHIFRRLFHISMVFIPFLYYWYGNIIAENFSNLFGLVNSRNDLIIFILLIIIFLESLRLAFGIVIFGQREYEKKQISALAWGGLSLCICLLFAPLGGYKDSYIGMPIILTLSIVDPILGETRKHLTSNSSVISIALIVSVIIWLSCSFMLGTPYYFSLIMPPLSIAAEWPSMKYVDDNATMILIPLVFSMLLI